MSGLDFYNLQRSSEQWDGIIRTSRTFGATLQLIKDAYDNYVNFLLDQQLENRTLHDTDGMVENSFLRRSKMSLHCNIDNNDGVYDEEKEVQALQQDIKKLKTELEESYNRKRRLEVIVKEEESGKTENEDEADHIFQSEMEKFDSGRLNQYKVESLQTKIELKARDLDAFSLYRKRFFVPVAVYGRLEGCIKETEVDVQKLCKQNEFLEKNLDQLEDELDDVLVKTGVKQKTSLKLWKKVDTEKVIDIVNFTS